MKHLPITLSLLLILVILQSCYRVLPSKGGGQLSSPPQQFEKNAQDILIPEGYEIEAVATKLTFPTAITFDEDGMPYIIESGYSYGEIFLKPKLYQLTPDGSLKLIATGEKNGPWNGITYYRDNFYISEGGQLNGGEIVKVNRDGQITPLVEGLPSLGDHHTNGPLINDGYLYFGQGTATNSGVVGNDNADFGWLKRYPDFHDIPCEDILVNQQNFKSENMLNKSSGDQAQTGPYSPYNTPVVQNQRIKGDVPCSGAVLRLPMAGGDLELVAWGFRNPYGMAVAPDGTIYITDNSFDVRGSRPVWGTGDLLWKLEEDKWYGWPDFNGGVPITAFEVPGEKDPKPLLAEHPGTPPKPVATFAVHSSANGMDFSSNEAFGFTGQAFVAEFGDMAPVVGKVISPVGYKVVRVDVTSGIIEDFVVNKEKGPASRLKNGGLERPVAVQFNPAGDALYIVDFGIVLMGEDQGAVPVKETGAVWKVTKK